jgi:CheY-like chemotaxis protein
MEKLNNVLLVDDDEASTFVTRKMLEKLAVAESINVACNGQMALQYMRTHGGAPTCPSLILLDINMPLMNGFEFLEHLRAVPLIQPVRIVLLSSSVSPKDAREAEAFGVEGEGTQFKVYFPG